MTFASVLGEQYGFSISRVRLLADETKQLSDIIQGMVLFQYAEISACYSYHRGDRTFTKLYGTTSFDSKFEPQIDSNGVIQIHNKFNYDLYMVVRIYN